MITSPRVICNDGVDCFSLKSILESPAFVGLKNEKLMLAFYDYFTSQETGFYHFWPNEETHGIPQKATTLGDPLKLLNVYGRTICGQNSSFLNGLYRRAGYESRVFSLPGHVMCEVKYDDKWHVFDVDMWTWFKNENGDICGSNDLMENAKKYILENENKSSPCNLPDRDMESYAKIYEGQINPLTTTDHVFPSNSSSDHSMDYVLRPGESISRSEENEGRFHLPKSWYALIEDNKDEWSGYPRERFAPFRSYGNGRWLYEPALSNEFSDISFGDWDLAGVIQTEKGLKGKGYATFKIQSPYPFVGIPNLDACDPQSDNGGFLYIKGQGHLSIAISHQESGYYDAISTIDQGGFDCKFDITKMLEGRYQVEIMINFLEDASLDYIKFDSFIMHAPITMPKLSKGLNRLDLRSGDEYSFSTIPDYQIVDFRNSESIQKNMISLENGKIEIHNKNWHCIKSFEGKSLISVFRFDCLKDIKWFYVHADINEALDSEDELIRAEIEYSFDAQKWFSGSSIECQPSSKIWDVGLNLQEVLEKVNKTIFLKITTNTKLMSLRFTAHELQTDLPEKIQVRHDWHEKENRSFEKILNKNDVYEITCVEKPEKQSLTFSRVSEKK